MSFSSKVVIITGASSGIGAKTAVQFSKESASVALVGRNLEKLKDTSEKCSKAGGRNIVIQADVSDDVHAKRIINNTIEKFGKIDILVNNAGIIDYGTLLGGTILQSYDRTSKVNLRAVINLTSLAASHLVETKGNVINIASVLGHCILDPKFTGYSAVKAGLEHFTRGAALEFGPHGVRVNAISPGPVYTELFNNSGSSIEVALAGLRTPLDRMSEPEEIAHVITFLASEKSKGTTGSIFHVDNGLTLK